MPKKNVNISWLKNRAPLLEGDDASIFAPAAEEARSSSQETRTLLVDPQHLLDNPYQKREDYPHVDSLADSMRQFGFRGSIPVRPYDTHADVYQVCFGHRRVRAAARAGVPVRVEIVDYSDEDMLLLAIRENFEREDLTPLEEGNSFLELNETFGLSQEAIAALVGEGKKEKIDRGYVRNRLRAAKLARKHPEVKVFLKENPGSGYLRAIGYLDDEGLGERELTFLLKRLYEDQWTADTMAAAVKILKEGGDGAIGLLTTKTIAPVGSEGVNQQDGHTSQAPYDDQAGPVEEIGTAQGNDVALVLKRSSKVTDALKRMRRYTQMIGEATPSPEERATLLELMDLVQLMLSRAG